MKDEVIVGIDIGGTNLRIGAVDSENKIVSFDKISSKKVFVDENGSDCLCDFIGNYIEEHKFSSVAAIAIGFPSTINKERTTILNTPNIKGLNNINIVEKISEKLNIPVYLDKDVVMLFYNDLHTMGIEQKGIMIGCYIGTGIGNVISINSQILEGADGVASELGHIPTLGKTDICNCGNIGCLENYASGRNLEVFVRENFSDCEIQDIFTKHGGDSKVLEFVDMLAVPIAIEINILNPDLIILGGGVLSIRNFPINILEECIKKYARKPLPCNNLNIVYSKDDSKNGVMGATYLAKIKLTNERVNI